MIDTYCVTKAEFICPIHVRFQHELILTLFSSGVHLFFLRIENCHINVHMRTSLCHSIHAVDVCALMYIFVEALSFARREVKVNGMRSMEEDDKDREIWNQGPHFELGCKGLGRRLLVYSVGKKQYRYC